MRDWPVALKRNAVACTLAIELYEAERYVYGGDETPFHQLPPHIKHRYITDAADWLKTQGEERERRRLERERERFHRLITSEGGTKLLRRLTEEHEGSKP